MPRRTNRPELVVAHELRLLEDGKPRVEVYGNGKFGHYLWSKTGLSEEVCEDYCKRRAAQPNSDEAEGIKMLCALLLKV